MDFSRIENSNLKFVEWKKHARKRITILFNLFNPGMSIPTFKLFHYVTIFIIIYSEYKIRTYNNFLKYLKIYFEFCYNF